MHRCECGFRERLASFGCFLKPVTWLRFIIIFSAFGALRVEAKSGAQHVQDLIDCVFNAERSEASTTLSRFVTEGMDMGSGAKPLDLSQAGSSFMNTVRDDLGGSLRGFGAHRELGHWAFDGSIPKAYFDHIDDLIAQGLAPDNAKEIFIARWQEFVASRTEAVKQVFQLSGPNSDRAARSFASMMNDVHNLGDHTTKATQGLRSIDDIVDNYLKSVNRILGNHNGITAQLKSEIAKLPKGLSDAERAARVLDIMKAHNAELFGRIETAFRQMGFSGRLSNVDFAKLGQHLDDAGLRANARIPDLARKASASKIIGNVKNNKGAFVRCNAKKVKLGGRMVDVLEVPVVTKNGVTVPAETLMKQSAQDAKAVRAAFAKAGAAGGRIVGKSTIRAAGKQVATQTVVRGGSTVSEFLKTPKGDAVTAGILTFVIDEGCAIVQYSTGEVARDQFVQKTIFNAGKAGVMGGVTYGICFVAGAVEAPLVVSLAAMVGAGIVVEKGGEYIWAEYEKSNGVLDGVSDDELLVVLPDCVRKRTTWTAEAEDKKLDQYHKNNKRYFDSDDDAQPWREGRTFY